jgi:hypothetical protein
LEKWHLGLIVFRTCIEAGKIQLIVEKHLMGVRQIAFMFKANRLQRSQKLVEYIYLQAIAPHSGAMFFFFDLLTFRTSGAGLYDG